MLRQASRNCHEPRRASAASLAELPGRIAELRQQTSQSSGIKLSGDAEEPRKAPKPRRTVDERHGAPAANLAGMSRSRADHQASQGCQGASQSSGSRPRRAEEPRRAPPPSLTSLT